MQPPQFSFSASAATPNEGGGDDQLDTKGKQKHNAKVGRKQLASGVENGDHYSGAKTGVGFDLGKKGGSVDNYQQNVKPRKHKVDVLESRYPEFELAASEETRQVAWHPSVDSNVDEMESRTPTIDLPEIQETRRVQYIPPKEEVKVKPNPNPVSLPYNHVSNPWNPISGVLGDLDGSLDVFLRTIVRTANGNGFTQISIQADILPANWATFNAWQDVTQRSMLQVSSMAAANNLASRLRVLGLRRNIAIVILNNTNSPSPTVANGIRFGAGAASRPPITLNLR